MSSMCPSKLCSYFHHRFVSQPVKYVQTLLGSVPQHFRTSISLVFLIEEVPTQFFHCTRNAFNETILINTLVTIEMDQRKIQTAPCVNGEGAIRQRPVKR